MLVGLHLYTHHFEPGYCDSTQGVYVVSEKGLGAGVMRNSECRVGAYLAWSPETNVLRVLGANVSGAITVGLIAGYKSHPVAPLVSPSLIAGYGDTRYRLSYLPKPPSTDGSAGVHFSIEWRF